VNVEVSRGDKMSECLVSNLVDLSMSELRHVNCFDNKHQNNTDSA
jgi:hypothetical protein